MAIMDRYKLELVSAGRNYVRICKVNPVPASNFALGLERSMCATKAELRTAVSNSR